MFFYRKSKKRFLSYCFLMIILVISGYAYGYVTGLRIDKRPLEYEIKNSHVENKEENLVELDMDEIETLNIESNVLLNFKRYYTKCSHIIDEGGKTFNINKENTLEDLISYYQDWDIEKKSGEKIILSKEIEGYCPDHYILKDKDGIVYIYQSDDNGTLNEISKTNIYTDWIDQDLRGKLIEGIAFDNIEEIEHIIEDLES